MKEETMSNMNNEWQVEQQRVTEITNDIRKRLDSISDESGDIKTEIIDIKSNFWDDVTVNFEDAAESAETFASMKQQAELLSERERSYRLLVNEVKTLQKLEVSPYFGRIDIKEDGAETEAIYLGVGSLLDESGEHYLIYDWRAPISSVYYDYGPGPISYKTPTGLIEGEMSLKRQYIIRYGKLHSMFDTGLTIGDDILKEVLGKQSDSQMKSIVATIQAEQNQIIRNEKAKLLVVQGAAGSGKTSAALQRVAYLLYRYRDTITADQIVLFSPNPMFNSYVSSVLPELGEQNMQQTTYQQYLEHRLGDTFEVEDPFVQLEYGLTEYDDPKYDIKMDSIRLKSSLMFMDAIDEFADNLKKANFAFKNISHRGKRLISREQLSEFFYSLNENMSIPNRLQEVTRYILKELTNLAKVEAKEAGWVAEQIEYADESLYREAENYFNRKNKHKHLVFEQFDSIREYVATKIVQREFKLLRRAVKLLRYIDLNRMYVNMLEHIKLPDVTAERWMQIAELTVRNLRQRYMTNEDATAYLYLKEKIEGFQTNTSIKYVFIDEGQDYSPFQYQFLKRIFPRSKMTILGDFNQSIFIHSSLQEKFEPFANVYSEEEIERINLNRSYRSTYEIVQFTSKIVNQVDHIIPFNRHGREPLLINGAGKDKNQLIDDQLHSWIRYGYETIAIICKTALEVDEAYEALSPRWRSLVKIHSETATFPKGVVVIPAYLAKGVEFDCVFIYDASADTYNRETERRLFYTACTRAMHELTLLYDNNLTPFISNN